MSRSTVTVLAGAATAALILTACGGGNDNESSQLRLAHVFGVDSTMNVAAEEFASRLAQESDGRFEVAVYPASQLGGDEVLGQDLSRGTLDMAFLNPGSLAGMDPLMDFHYLPYIVSDYEQADAIYFGDGVIPETIRDTLGNHGMTNLATFELEFRAVTNDVRPVESLQDLRGLKLRVPGSAAIRGFFDAAGVQTLVMPMPELVSGLQQGTVDGQDNGVLITTDAGLAESQTYYTPTRHVYAVGSIAISTAVWDDLSEEDQELIQRVATEIAAEQVAENRERVDAYNARLADVGVQMTELTDEQLAEFRDFGLQQWDSFAGTYGADRIERLRQEVEALNG